MDDLLRLLKTGLVLASLFGPFSAHAQEASGLSLGQPLTPKRQIGESYVVAKQDDWAIRCITTADGNDPCELFQLLVRQEGNPIAEISVFPLPAGEPAVAGATLVVPLETLLTEPLIIEFSANKAKEYPYSYCNPVGCVVRIGFDAQDLSDLKQGNEITMAISHIKQPGQKLILPISLIGFTAMYDRLIKAGN